MSTYLAKIDITMHKDTIGNLTNPRFWFKIYKRDCLHNMTDVIRTESSPVVESRPTVGNKMTSSTIAVLQLMTTIPVRDLTNSLMAIFKV